MVEHVIVGLRPLEGRSYQFWRHEKRTWTIYLDRATTFDRSEAEDMAERLRDDGSFQPIAPVPRPLVRALLDGLTRVPDRLDPAEAR